MKYIDLNSLLENYRISKEKGFVIPELEKQIIRMVEMIIIKHNSSLISLEHKKILTKYIIKQTLKSALFYREKENVPDWSRAGKIFEYYRLIIQKHISENYNKIEEITNRERVELIERMLS